jgi:hypothetical protein
MKEFCRFKELSNEEANGLTAKRLLRIADFGLRIGRCVLRVARHVLFDCVLRVA